MKIAVAGNHVGFRAKNGILFQLKSLQHEVFDFGPFNDEICDYPDFAAKAGRAVSRAEVDRAILVGGTGIGMSIVANKFQGVRAALCHDDLSAEMSRRYNNANILCLSVDLMGEQLAAHMIELWLTTPFEGGHHARRIAKIAAVENEIWSLDDPQKR
jgi:ribose 5-phosphate isomerase B